jgi:hypothetical protein
MPLPDQTAASPLNQCPLIAELLDTYDLPDFAPPASRAQPAPSAQSPSSQSEDRKEILNPSSVTASEDCHDKSSRGPTPPPTKAKTATVGTVSKSAGADIPPDLLDCVFDIPGVFSGGSAAEARPSKRVKITDANQPWGSSWLASDG